MTGPTTAPPDVSSLSRPAPEDCKEYFLRYTSLVPDGDILAMLAEGEREFQELLRPVPESRGSDRYAPGKWSIKEVVGHLLDTERVFAARAHYIGRGGSEPLPSFDQDAFVDMARFDRSPLADLLRQYAVGRQSTLDIFRSFDFEAAQRRGVASGAPTSVRALAWIIAGHERHHAAQLRERYLAS